MKSANDWDWILTHLIEFISDDRTGVLSPLYTMPVLPDTDILVSNYSESCLIV
jgi:hypothetical protein